jgi:hypothetical protein
MSISPVSGVGTVTLDELWLLDVTHGAMTLVNCGGATRLWIDSPDASANNRPGLYVGTQDDRSDAAGLPLVPFAQHLLDPDGMVLYSVTDGVAAAKVSASFYQRGHTHPPVDNTTAA